MRFTFYTHSLISDWNHGNAHFLRGVMKALQGLGHTCIAMEPATSWSRTNLVADRGKQALAEFSRDFPMLRAIEYADGHDHEEVLAQSDVVVVHEWTDPALVARLGRARSHGGEFRLLFHDTHHRAVSAEAEIAGMDLSGYDAVLAFGEALRQRYLESGWGRQVFTWHEAADDDLFKPHAGVERDRDLVWIGNWGDGERSRELSEFLVRPVARLGLSATVHGVRYPPAALEALASAGIRYRGSLPNARVPEAFSRHRVTVHVPRRPYLAALPGIPTIRVFEALACGIPLVSAPWHDIEGLFSPGSDFLTAADGGEMTHQLGRVLSDPDLAQELAANGLNAIAARHTCRHRAQELLSVLRSIGAPAEETTA
jgi:spore maturation protein CgeB